MHELAIAENIITAVLKRQQAERLGRILTVGLRIGELTDVVDEALEFGYSTAITETPLAGSRLEIERVPISGSCRTCGQSVRVTDFRFTCPSCFSSDLDITAGLELDIAWLELEDTGHEEPAQQTAENRKEMT